MFKMGGVDEGEGIAGQGTSVYQLSCGNLSGTSD